MIEGQRNPSRRPTSFFSLSPDPFSVNSLCGTAHRHIPFKRLIELYTVEAVEDENRSWKIGDQMEESERGGSVEIRHVGNLVGTSCDLNDVRNLANFAINKLVS
ncbi:hypothetical protein L1987_37736 [Smallanthus sonchifolius]|uniref:Uncharacterized protein n=1 Tax=Smallanthus sonchifolius TaxID=185202 RepID=A0ACB9HHL6_9ASTR|nr:hypothetical protein L1987_37736 [Smallanthus sonchifolius]